MDYLLEIPEGSRWRHYKNQAIYKVLMLTNTQSNDQKTYTTTVVYEGPNGYRWSRPAYDWHRSMTRVVAA
jgi:hypothetical protein